MKNKRGITLIALIITVIIMLILVGVGIYLGGDAVNKVNLEDIKAEMFSIKTKAKIVVDKYNFKDIENLVGTKYADAQGFNKELVNSSFTGFTNEQKENLYIWTKEDLENNGLTTIKTDSDKFYVVYYNLDEPNSSEIYYSKGYDGKFSLSELQDI